MDEIAVEFLVEPFTEGAPGPHVQAAVAALEACGLPVDVGAFANTTAGPRDTVADGVAALLRAALDAGATRIALQVGTPAAEGGSGLAGSLHGALDRLVAAVERELGGPLASLPREQKQAAVRLLDELGAFLLRRSVEDVADHMGVSRITIYNYLNAIEHAPEGQR